MMRLVRAAAAVGLMLCVMGGAGCKNEGSAAKDEPFYVVTAAALRNRGVHVGELKPMSGERYGATACAEGEAEQLRVLLCRYPDGEAAERSRSRLVPFVQSAVTGVVRRAGDQLLAIADVERKDLKGEHIQQLSAAFAELDASASAPRAAAKR